MKKLCAITTVDVTMTWFVLDAMKEIRDSGYDVTLICSMSKEFQDKNSSEFHCINLPMKRGISIKDLFCATYSFYKIFRENEFEYVQYTSPNASLYASIAAYLARVPHRVYCQWGLRYVGSQGITRRLLKMMERFTCSLSTDIRSASRKNLEFAEEEGLFKKGKGKIVGDGGTVGVDFNQFDISLKSSFKKEILLKYPILANKTIFCFVGRIQRDKGVIEYLEAAIELLKERSDIAFLLVGFNDDKSLEPLCLEAQKNQNIIFTGFTKEVQKYMAVADILVHPSYREGFSQVIQQAMAMSLPVITTDIPGPSEVIENQKTGILVPAKDKQSLYEAMRFLVDDKELQYKMGQAGHERAKKLFNRQRMLRLTKEDRISILNN